MTDVGPNTVDNIGDEKTELKELSKTEKAKAKLLSKLMTGERDNLVTKVAHLLNEYPDTRNSDITLMIKYWEIYEGLNPNMKMSPKDLYKYERLTSIARQRALIQNDYELFPADNEVRKHRKSNEEEIKEDVIFNKPSTSSMYVYADESGKNDTYLVVGGFWVHSDEANKLLFVPDQEVKRIRNESEHEIKEFHFTKMRKHQLSQYGKFFDHVHRSLSTATFVAIAVNKTKVQSVPLSELVFEMYKQFFVFGVDHLVTKNRIKLPKQVHFFKDRDVGDDQLHLVKLVQELQQYSETKYKGELMLPGITPMVAEKTRPIQFSDLVTSAVSRDLNSKEATSNHKDEFAAKVLSTIDFERVNIDASNLFDINLEYERDKSVLFVFD